MKNLHDFLAITKKINTKTLVIEEWIFDYMLDLAYNEYNKFNYDKFIILGFYGDKDQKYPRYKNILISKGIPTENIIYINPVISNKNRTINSIKELKKYANENNLISFNYFTGGPHGRKSYVLLKKVLGKNYNFGIISSEIIHYNSKFWWSSPRGFMATIKNLFGYLHAKFFLYP